MSDFFKLVYDLGAKIVYNLVDWVVSFFTGFAKLFITGWGDYATIFTMYFSHFGFAGKLLAILLAIVLVAIPVIAIILLVKRIVLQIRLRATNEDNVTLYKEIGLLNRQVMELMDEKNRILDMKAGSITGNSVFNGGSAVGGAAHPAMNGEDAEMMLADPMGSALADPLADPYRATAINMDVTSAGASATAEGSIDLTNDAVLGAMSVAAVNAVNASQKLEDKSAENAMPRFLKLSYVDAKYIDYERPEFDNEVTLEQFAENFRLFAASQMGLYYTPEIIRCFVAGLAASHILILEGISGTGKTSLPYAFSRYINNPATLISVQPSYRDRTELIGYFNEFSKRFNETEFLRALYEANYREDPSLVILDEMNLARIEYYFAEMLSVLELPNKSEWMLDLVPTAWPNDPHKLVNGKITVPPTIWFVGTANNDDSTFTITDKVYDRSIPIELNERAAAFDCEPQFGCNVTCRHLEEMFAQAKIDHPVSEELVEKMMKLDNYLQTRFKLAFGNRITKQMYDYIPVYVACGGKEIDAMDYIICRKVFKKFETLNVTFVRDEIKNLISYMEGTFGKSSMAESRAYLLRIQNLY